jgi:hypothetical protein
MGWDRNLTDEADLAQSSRASLKTRPISSLSNARAPAMMKELFSNSDALSLLVPILQASHWLESDFVNEVLPLVNIKRFVTGQIADCGPALRQA